LPWPPRSGLEIEDDDEEKKDGEGYGTFFEEHPYFDVDSCWSEPSGSPPRASHTATDLDSIVDSDSGESAHSVLQQQQQQQQLTEDLLNEMPDDPSGQTGTSDWLNSLTFFSFSPEDRLGSIIGNQLNLISILGVGSHSVVYGAVDINTNTQYAVKALSKDPRYLELLKTEIRLHQQASGHPNVVSILQVMDDIDVIYVVLEFFPEGDLFYNIVDKGNYVGNDTLVKGVFIQILDAVQYCHLVGIYHRNLAPENFLVADGGMTVRLTDFALASKDAATSDFGCGAVFYMSPGKKSSPVCNACGNASLNFGCKECQQPDPPPNASYLSAPNDVWSLGVILVNLTCGRNPWKRASPEDSTYRAYTKDPSFLQSILPLSTDVTAILNRIFECDPSKRITLPELRSLIMECPRFTTDFPPSWLPSRRPDPPGQDADNLGGPNQYGTAPETPDGSVVEGQHHDNVESYINVPDYEDEEWMYQSSGGQ
jgi:serine/threonine protein kinase